MINEESKFDEFLINASNQALISYVAMYRSMKANKQNSIKCMVELDNRRQNGEDIPYEKLIEDESSIIKSIGKGFIVEITKHNLDIALSNIRKISPAMIFNKKLNLIHIGIPNQEKINLISRLEEVSALEPDKKYLEKI